MYLLNLVEDKHYISLEFHILSSSIWYVELQFYHIYKKKVIVLILKTSGIIKYFNIYK